MFGYVSRALLVMACLAGTAQAGLVIKTPSLVVDYRGQSGWFDVIVQYVPDSSGPNPEYSVAGFTVGITIAAPGVVFTGIDESTTLPYLLGFAGSNHDGLTLVDPIPPGGSTSLIFYDSTEPAPGSAPPFVYPGRLMNADAPNNAFGLARIHYQIAPDATYGDFPITIDAIPSDGGVTDLTSSDGDSIIEGVSGGTMRVVPEPSTLVGAAFCGLAALLAAGRRRSRTAA